MFRVLEVMHYRNLKICAIVEVVLNGVLLIILLVVCVTFQPDTIYSEMEEPDIAQETVTQILTTERKKEKERAEVENVAAEIYDKYKRGSVSKPAGHFVISQQLPFHGNMHKLTWDTHSNLTHTCGGVSYEDGGIVVGSNGYYYIYSTIRYVGDGTEELDFGRILHNVLMKKDTKESETPTILMQNLQSTPTIRRGRQAYTTSSLGATFYLEANSRVMVNSSLAGNIDKSPYGSYFGLFLM